MSDTDIASLRERLRARLEQVRARLRDLELDATLVRGRTEEAREEEAALMEMLDDSPRRRPGRPRNVSVMNPTPPQHADTMPDLNLTVTNEETAA